MGCGNCFGRKEPPKFEPPYSIEPPKRRKKILFDKNKYTEVDKHASKVALRLLKKDLGKLTNHLRKKVDDQDDLGMLRTLFVWVTRLKLNDILERGIPEGTMPNPNSPLDFLSSLKANLINHANFFKILCEQANIPCEVITGINKNASYKIGHRLNHDRLKAQWNAVYVCGEWRFVDVHWASNSFMGSKSTDWVVVNMKETDEEEFQDLNEPELKVINDFFFLTDPDMFICTHFPDDPQWQLLPQPVLLNRFESSVYVRDKFFTLGLSVSDITKKNCVLQTVDGLLEVGFDIPEAKSAKAAFRFLFYNYKQEFQFDSGFTLEHYVLNQLSVDSVNFTLRFPKTGTFRFDIFGRESPNALFDMVCSYVVQCKEPRPRCLPLPFIPDAGWGPTIACHKLGITPKTHKNAVITTPDGVCDIQFHVSRTMWMKFKVLSTGTEDWLLKKSVLAWREEDNVCLRTRFREEGEYALKFVASDILTLGKSENICNYLITVQTSSNLAEFPLVRGCMLGPTDMADTFEVKPVSHESAIIRTPNRNIILTMALAENAEMLAEVTNNEVASSVIYENVSRSQTSGNVVFNIDFPSKEEFGINLYVKKQGENQAVYHTYTYYVVIDGNSQSNSQTSLQNYTVSESSAHSSTQSETTSSQQSTENVALPEIILPVSVATAKKSIAAKVVTRLKQMYCELSPEETSPSAIRKLDISSRSRDTETLFTVGLPHLGEYNLNVFEEISPGFISMFATFNIHRSENVTKEIDEVSQAMSYKEKKYQLLSMKREEQVAVLKRALKVGIRTKSTQMLKQTLKQMEDLQIEDDEEQLISKAKEMLQWLKIKDELTKAMSQRDRKRLEYLLDSVTNNNLVNKLSVEVAAAKRLLKYLKRLERLKHLRQQRIDVMNLDAPTMAEIRSYSKPPVPVHLVLMATCILLGEDSDELQDWSDVKKIISQSGKMSLQHRVYHYNMEGLTIEMAKEAQCVLNNLSMEDILVVSPAAATFYVWAKSTVNEVEIRYEKEGLSHTDTKPASKNHHKILSIVNDYFASKRGHPPKDDFDNIDAAFGQPTKEAQVSSQPKNSIYDSGRRQSQFAASPSLSSKKENSDADRLEHVKSVWDTLDDE